MGGEFPWPVVLSCSMIFENSLAFALELDQQDKLRSFRDKFFIPHRNGSPLIYFCGNSLGLQPKTVSEKIQQELHDWQQLAVEGHLHGKNPWFYYHHFFEEECELVGALPEEVVLMNALTVNLHLLMISFYQPQGRRFKIMMEANAFPSDRYAVQTQLKLRGYNPQEGIIELTPRPGEYTLRTEDILYSIENHKHELALILLGGVNYYTGQFFDIPAVTQAGHEGGAMVGIDLAHAAGNVLLQLHDWEVDFAAWCTYKYLNSGPGGVGGAFVHERHCNNPDLPRLAGWWGNDEKTRFEMPDVFHPQPGAAGWQVSNAPVFPMAIHKASLEIFKEAGMENLREKSEKLTGYLEFILHDVAKQSRHPLKIITPADKNQRGCQLSVHVGKEGKHLYGALKKAGVIVDWREPDVIRMAPVPLYNTFSEVFEFGQVLNKIL
ncbi:MAG: kynureninase [Chitinophagales bacterium]|nr:MAG: kynureninase [Chitinophagales bacterium]